MAKQKYEWADGRHHHSQLDANKVGQELDALRNEEGVLDIHEVLEWATNHPKSELAKGLEWDDDRAAFEYRLHQLRVIVASVRRVTVGGGEVQLKRAHYSIGGGHYASPEAVEQDEEYQTIVLQRALRSLQGWTTRYEEVLHLCGGKAAAQRLLRALAKAAA